LWRWDEGIVENADEKGERGDERGESVEGLDRWVILVYYSSIV
jgi:hypothetical protein